MSSYNITNRFGVYWEHKWTQYGSLCDTPKEQHSLRNPPINLNCLTSVNEIWSEQRRRSVLDFGASEWSVLWPGKYCLYSKPIGEICSRKCGLCLKETGRLFGRYQYLDECKYAKVEIGNDRFDNFLMRHSVMCHSSTHIRSLVINIPKANEGSCWLMM